MPILSVSGSSAARAAASPQLKNSALDRLFAEAMHSGMKDYEKRLQPIKTELFAAARGYLDTLTSPQVLEIGIGTGPNLRYLRSPGANSDVHILGLEPNQYMIPYLKEEAARVGLDVTVIPGVAESMTTIPSASIDLVVCTLVLCSVTDASRALEEMARVLKPAGRLLIIEHVRGSGLTQLGQTVFSPLQQFLADGCHLDRDFTEDPAAGRLFEVSGIKATDVGGLGLLARHKYGLLSLSLSLSLSQSLSLSPEEIKWNREPTIPVF